MATCLMILSYALSRRRADTRVLLRMMPVCYGKLDKLPAPAFPHRTYLAHRLQGRTCQNCFGLQPHYCFQQCSYRLFISVVSLRIDPGRPLWLQPAFETETSISLKRKNPLIADGNYITKKKKKSTKNYISLYKISITPALTVSV